MRTLKILGILLVLLFIAGCQQSNSNTENIAKNTATNEEVIKITSSDLSTHSTGEDCWVGYKSKIYDVTEFLQKHPGGANAIIPYCGTSEEFTKAFEGKHGISKIAVLEKEGIYKGDLS